MNTSGAAGASCGYCSGNGVEVFHGGVCPRVKAIEYHSNGGVKRVEFHDVPPVMTVFPAAITAGVTGTLTTLPTPKWDL